MSTLLPPAGLRRRPLAPWIGVALLATIACFPAYSQPTVNGLYYGDGDAFEYSAIAVSPAGRGVLYVAVDNDKVYALIRVDTTANDNVFGICKNNAGADCAVLVAQGWGGNGKEHTYKRLWDSEYSDWEVSCADIAGGRRTHTWTWQQNYMSPKTGSSCTTDTDPDLCQGEWESAVTSGTPPDGTVMSTSLVYNMNNYDEAKWDATAGGTRSDGNSYRSDPGLVGHPRYSAALDYEWNMNYEISFPMPPECDPATITRGVVGAHHSPDKDGGGDIVISEDPVFDLGDNPDSYGTLLGSSGARHRIHLTTVVLGAMVDAEDNGAPSSHSDGDDNATSDDEDGVTFPGLGRNECFPGTGPGSGLDLDIAYATDSASALLDAWIDWNRDGDYDSEEKILEIDLVAADAADAGGLNGVADLPTMLCQPTGDVFDGDSTHARFRVHLGDTPLGPLGDAVNGEVEDYILFFSGAGTRILPVELIEFGAVMDDADAVLRWSTASETNNAGFSVEHGTDFDGFREVGFVEGAGTTVDEQAYTYRVLELAPGIHRFRLKQIDLDGAFEYSTVLEIVAEVPGLYLLEQAYPNPFNPTTNIRFAIARDELVTMNLIDVTGRVITTLYEDVARANEMITVKIDATGLASGIYVVRLGGSDFVATQVITVLK